MSFTPAMFEKKLSELNASQQSIQTLSLWLIHHRRHFKAIVQTWLKGLKKPEMKVSKRLTFMYLANDVIQNSKKKGPEFSKEFLTVLKPAVEYISKNEMEESTKKSIDRILKIWEERGIYDRAAIKVLRHLLHGGTPPDSGNNNHDSSSNSTPDVIKPKIKSHKRKREPAETLDVHNGATTSKMDKNGSSNIYKRLLADKLDTAALNEFLPKINNLVENFSVDLDKFETIEPEKLVKALKELEASPSGDQGTRQKIASMPPEIFDVKLIEDRLEKEGNKEHWSKIVDEAQQLLSGYNTLLASELEDRKQLAVMLAYFIEGQRRSLNQTEQSLGEYRDKLRKVISVREELKSHLRNLPDLSQPSVMPLPSASDLFKM